MPLNIEVRFNVSIKKRFLGNLKPIIHSFCSDIDECTSEKHGCEQVCINKLGSYYCLCEDGYYLHQDGKTCKGMIL